MLSLIIACLLLPPPRAFAEEPRHTIAAGAGVFLGNYGIASIELAGGRRTQGHTIWYVRADLGRTGSEVSSPNDDLALEVRTGPVWRHCMVSGCLGISLELGVQRVSTTRYRDSLSAIPPLVEGEWNELGYFVVTELRWRGELYYYRDGLVSLEANLGIRAAPGMVISSDPDVSGDDGFVVGGGLVGGLALIVRR